MPQSPNVTTARFSAVGRPHMVLCVTIVNCTRRVIPDIAACSLLSAAAPRQSKRQQLTNRQKESTPYINKWSVHL